MITKNSSTLFCGLLMLFIAMFVPQPSFNELSTVMGKVLLNEAKGSSGANLKVSRTDNSEILFNIPNSNKITNEIIERIVVGNEIKVWFSDSYTLYRDSYDAWQVSINGEVIIGYDEVHSTSKIYFYLLLAIGIILFLVFFYNIKNKKGQDT